MKHSLTLVVGGVVVLLLTALADATINVKVAEVQNGVAFVQGNKAAPSADIFWEGERVTQANKGGNFSFTGVIPADCVGTLSDGTPVEVALLNCTPVALAPAPVPQTGQMLCYAADGSATIPCVGTGQDGELQNGVSWPEPRFTDNTNGTATDNLTGLIWLKEANCFGALTWSEALSSASALSNGNCNLSDGSNVGDWRVPNLRELLSLVDFGSNLPALPSGHPFVNLEPSAAGNFPYWTSTTEANSWGNAWVVAFSTGGLSSLTKPSQNFLLLVREGQ